MGVGGRGGGAAPFSGACVNASYLTRYASACLPGEFTHSGIMHSGAYGGLGHLLNPTWTNGFTIRFNKPANRWDMVLLSGAGGMVSGYQSDWLSGVDGGRITFNGDGSGTQFVIPHALTRPLTNKDTWWVTPASSGAAGDFYVTLSGAGGALLVNYKTAPASGTNNVVLQWGVTKLVP